MNEVTILHLSDLHISGKKGRLSNVLRNLIDDIEQQLIYTETTVLVVTGDIIHKGNYEHKQSAVNFFELLNEKIGEKIIDVYIVPGNHDKERSCVDSELIKNCNDTRKELDKEYYKEYWKYHMLSFQSYISMLCEIYKIFGKEYDYVEDTFGVKVTSVRTNNICFISLNSSWACYKEKEQRCIRIGNFQLELVKDKLFDLRESYVNKKQTIDLTIILLHHPLEWLYDFEEDNAKAYILGNNSFNADVMLCGHTHNLENDNWYSSKQSLTTLKTGFGWPDKDEENHPALHSYSIYVFNMDINSVDIYMRSSDDRGKFHFDYTTYPELFTEI